jgi:hypothetical protein
MDQGIEYVKKARAAGMSDEDIIAELTNSGWSIQQVHTLLYANEINTDDSTKTLQQNQNSVIQPQQNAVQINEAAEVRPHVSGVSDNSTPNNQVQNTQDSNPVAVGIGDIAKPQDIPDLSTQQAVSLESSPRSSMKKILKFSAIATGFIIVGMGFGVGGSYLYFQSQVAKYSSILETGSIGITSLDDVDSNPIIEIDSEDGVDQPDQASLEIDADSGEVIQQNTKKTDNATSPTQQASPQQPSNQPSSDQGPKPSQPKTSCKVNMAIPAGVCDAIRSIQNDPSPSNKYLSSLDLSGIPGGITINSIDENSWQAASGGGTIDAVAQTVMGPTNVRATFQKQGNEWRVVGILLI